MVFLDELDRINAACNTGPLISAFQCAGTELLKRYLAQLYVTPGELTELERQGTHYSDALIAHVAGIYGR